MESQERHYVCFECGRININPLHQSLPKSEFVFYRPTLRQWLDWHYERDMNHVS
jgi:hypothetical protein